MHTQLEQMPLSATTELLQEIDQQTPWTGLQLLNLADGQSVDVGEQEEATLILLQGEGCTAAGDRLTAPAALTTASKSAAFTVKGPTRLLCARVGLEQVGESQVGESASKHDTFDAKKLTWRPSIHGGSGQIATRHLWRPEDFHGDSWVFVDHAILGPDSSLGHHYHDALEEVFIILAGTGWMTIGERTFDVGPGSVTFHPIGIGHGLYNPTNEGLDFVRLAVGIPGETFTTIDLDSDLKSRRPQA
ncbi:MAG: cupin domain-containing protein [Gemmatimonadetes bacterium]|nr:cupin domain-containing protein [Gemmatimonadota bacterium]MBT6628234.1 cupin domain-containing protein [Gemmatimonadota bacterium]MBT7452683.1 cupin domain-containing protein [Gemmatimonadota bacterium]